jgi:coenzyme PQQ precursor peptide PqqA
MTGSCDMWFLARNPPATRAVRRVANRDGLCPAPASRTSRGRGKARGKNQENRQYRIQNTRMPMGTPRPTLEGHGTGRRPGHVPAGIVIHGRCPHSSRRCSMKWETPKAIDHRLGFEITMYVAVR